VLGLVPAKAMMPNVSALSCAALRRLCRPTHRLVLPNDTTLNHAERCRGSCSALLARATRSPDPGVSRRVKAAQDDNPIRLNDVEESVREAPQQRAVNYGVALRMASDPGDGCVDCTHEIVSKAQAALAVPEVRLCDIGFRRCRKDNRNAQRACESFERTSSHGTVREGSWPSKASRRSSSARCASVTGNISGAAAMLSQISSASCTRSATLSCSISSVEKRGMHEFSRLRRVQATVFASG